MRGHLAISWEKFAALFAQIQSRNRNRLIRYTNVDPNHPPFSSLQKIQPPKKVIWGFEKIFSLP
jgi:hypothetical protein